MKVSIIIPVFNEEKTIINVLRKIQEEKKNNKGINFEIIVVDDCSNDKTSSILKKKIASLTIVQKRMLFLVVMRNICL